MTQNLLEKIASYDQALEINPKDYQAWSGRGAVLNNLGRYGDAIASAEQSLKMAPEHYHAWYVKGYALNKT